MSQFKYTLPSGAEFVVNGPPGATQAQADKIFYEQVAAGSLVGYSAGQTLTSTATKITKFELSRLDRGTAGVDNPAILTVVQGIPIAAGIPNLSNVPLTDPINEGNIVSIKGNDLGFESIGANGITALTPYQVQKLLAQIANLVNQESDQISQNKGIGRYGFTAYALEEAGYVKPGTSLRFFAVNPEDFVSVMRSPSVWTGRDGIYALSDLLSDADLQNRIQVKLMQQGYDSLLSSGAITQPTTPEVKLSTGQVYTNSGLQNIKALTVASLLGSNLGSLNGIVQNALNGSTVLNKLLSGTNINLNTIGSGAVNSLTAGLGNLGNLANVNFASLASGLTNQLTGGIGALVTNASKFGSEATALWASSGGLSGITNLAGSGLTNLGSNLSNLAAGSLTNLAGGITGSLNNITTNLTNLVPGSLTNLTSSLDVFGKAGSFATNFANPLGNLNDLGGLLTSGGGIGGALTGQLGNLSNLGNLGNLGNLANLGNFANIGAVGDLFGGGGDLVSGTAVAGGFNNTVNRATVDAAFARVVGSGKVPLPIYQYPSLASLAPRLDIQQAFNFLRSSSGSASGTFGQTVTI